MAEELEPQPYLGAPVTLISSLDVRYEGILFTIDPNESTVALQNVKCLGTEDRQTGDKAIPKSDTVYEFIIFRGENIKTICLSEASEPKEKSPINDPSILKVGPTGTAPTHSSARSGPASHMQRGRHNNQNQHHQPRRYHQQHHNENRGWGGQPRHQHRNYYHQQNRGYGAPNRRYHRYNDGRRGRGGPHHQYRRNNNRYQNRGRNPRYNSNYAPGNAQFLTRSNKNQQDNPENVEDLKEFDFAEANARFAKNDFEEKLDEPQPAEAEAKKAEEPEKNTTEEEAAKDEPSEKEAKKEDEKADENKKDPAKAAAPQMKFEYKYNPDVSFFDDLDSGSEPRTNRNAKQRREVDTQTFGSIAANYAPRTYRNRYKGRRRFNNRNNNNRY